MRRLASVIAGLGVAIGLTALPSAALAAGAARTPASVVAAHAGERWFLGTVPRAARAADPAREPIRIGMINQEETPIGSYPELRVAVEAAVAWIDAELGGVDGRPIELLTCITRFSADQSRACAEDLVRQGVVAFVGGVDVNSGASVPVISAAGRSLIGGIPATLTEQRSPDAFFFSGGDSGALAAFLAHAARQGRTRIALAYAGDVESFTVAARDYGAAVGRALGLDVTLLPYPIFTTDFTSLFERAQADGADAVVMLASTTACVPAMQAAAANGFAGRLYLTGACAGDDVAAAAGPAADGVVFNAEGRVDGDDVDAALYRDVVARYATGPAGGAGTVGFRGMMNLYALLRRAGADTTPARLASVARTSVDQPSFWGHPYTCDGQQVPGLPALCAPQEILFRHARTGSGYTAVSGWIATDRLFERAAIGR